MKLKLQINPFHNHFHYFLHFNKYNINGIIN